MLKYTIRSRKGTKNLEISTKLPNGDIKRISAKTSNRKQADIKAKQIVADYENQINNAILNVNSAGRIIETRISDTVFLKDCVEYYLNEYCPNNSVKGIQNNRTNLEHIQKFFGIKTNVKTITPNDIVEYIKHRRNKGKKNGTISRELIIYS
ncbi:MAG: site-specific integrase [Pseudomonadota bacterium]